LGLIFRVFRHKTQRYTDTFLAPLISNLWLQSYTDAYDRIQRFVKQWKIDNRKSPSTKQAFIPLAFPAGEVCQFDWSQETVDLAGREICT